LEDSRMTRIFRGVGCKAEILTPSGVLRDRFAQFSLSHMHLDGAGR